MHRKIELQSPADFTYLYANTVALSRQKLDLHLPPSANPENDGPDPMRERVRELVDEFILRSFGSASTSISINGLDSTSPQFPFPAAFTAPAETVEYEPYDSRLASRVTSLYAQLESLNTTVAQLRRDAPRRAAEAYSEQLKKALEEDDEEDMELDLEFDSEREDVELSEDHDQHDDAVPKPTTNTNTTVATKGKGNEKTSQDIEMSDADAQQSEQPQPTTGRGRRSRQNRRPLRSDWKLQVPLGTDQEVERWRNGDMAEAYEDALRTLLRLQGEMAVGSETDTAAEGATDGNALASTVGKAERAAQAVDVVEKR
ncbi:hypothetical protein FE257_007648 [Aspergillus nanangensis]|uniref:Kinetochore protein mis14 n=1 Tax=Aspergillus nanangensis TaxID=2582783 RepID=A0AAD4CMC4_ASPNN|nr:hypothetical protein FE257_007648 [Aspergillus nanangensis]